MPTITFKAVEMSEAQVQRISLVERAASRIPFRVVKTEQPKEQPMKRFPLVDLASVLKREKPASEQPSVVGVVTMKSDQLPAITEQIKAAGFSVEKSEELEDGSVVFKQTDDVSGESAVIRVSDNAALVVKGLRPYMMDVTLSDGTTFAEVCKAQGFYPGVGTMVDVLRNSVLTLAEKSDDPATAAKEVSKMFDEAKQYAVALVQGLPAKAFKMEFVGPADEPAEGTAAGAGEGSSAKTADADPAASAAGSAGSVAKSDGAESNPDNKDGKPAAQQEPAKKSEADEAILALKAQVETIGTSVQESLKVLKGLGDGLVALTSRVEEAEKVSKSAKEAVEGSVTSGAGGSDPRITTARKSEGRGEIDTGFAPRSRSRGR